MSLVLIERFVMMNKLIALEIIERKIFLIRGHKVMLDKDLAVLYGIKPIRLREQVKRNIQRFPDDFMLQLNDEEINLMVSQNAIPSRKHLGGHHPYVFTEQGVAMLSSVLNTERAIQANIVIMRAFVKLRQFILSHKELNYRLKLLEANMDKHDHEIQAILGAIRKLMEPPPEKPKMPIGFRPGR